MTGQNKSLTECLADDIMSMILIEKRFRPGERLLSEKEFSKELFVSRATFREAVRILVERGILEARQGSGTYVCKNLPLNSTILPVTSSGVDAVELNEIRLMIEPEAAYFAALRASDSELKRISYYNLVVLEKVVANTDRRAEEIRFHMSIAQAVHNSFMDRLMPVIFEAIDATKNIFNYESIREGTIHDHQMIVQYLNERNADAARTAMRLHMLRGIHVLLEERAGASSNNSFTSQEMT